MAEKRMFAKTIIDSDAFLDMPATAQLLYFHLSMRADDDGFVNKPKAVMRLCGARDDDAKMLIEKKFLIPFESGVVVIKHWKIHNYIRKDTYHETKYKEEKSLLELDENDSYRLIDTTSLQTRDGLVTNSSQILSIPCTQERKEKKRIDKKRIDKSVCIDNALTQANGLLTNFEFSFSLKDSLRNWAMYKAERGEDYTDSSMSKLFGVTKKYADRYGEPSVVNIIETSMASGYKNIVFDRLDK